jgi:hypothetical protein
MVAALSYIAAQSHGIKMQSTLTYSVRKIRQSGFGGLGPAARYLREIDVMSDDGSHDRFSGWQIRAHELIEDGNNKNDLVTLFDSTSDMRRLCKAVYGCSSLELDQHLNSSEKSLYGAAMASCLVKVGANQSDKDAMGMDCLLVTDFSCASGNLEAPVSRKLAQGLRHFFKDVEYIIVAANKMSFESATVDANDRARADHVSGWSAMGFEQIGSTGYMLCPTSKLYIPA